MFLQHLSEKTTKQMKVIREGIIEKCCVFVDWEAHYCLNVSSWLGSSRLDSRHLGEGRWLYCEFKTSLSYMSVCYTHTGSQFVHLDLQI